MKLTKQDYLTVLKYYNVEIDKNTKLTEIKEKAEKILAEKLCKCIKKVQDPKDINESRSIAICRKSVLNNKGIRSSNFTCKKKAKFISKKGEKNLLTKIKNFTNKKV
jgi:hypothetical protein